jgi:hypothetical protein
MFRPVQKWTDNKGAKKSMYWGGGMSEFSLENLEESYILRGVGESGFIWLTITINDWFFQKQ